MGDMMLRRFECGIKAVRALGAAIGLDLEKTPIKSIDIHADCSSVPTVMVVMLMDVDGQGKLTEVLRRYELTERSAGPEDVRVITRLEPGEPDTVTDEHGTRLVKFRQFT